jgi:hypothetical protein
MARLAAFPERIARELLEMYHYLKRSGFAVDRSRETGYRQPVSSTRLYLYEITTTFSAGECIATIKNLAGDITIGTGLAVKDPTGHMTNIVAGTKGICAKEAGEYYAITPYVVQLRYVEPDLQLNKGTAVDGWVTWTTAADECPP